MPMSNNPDPRPFIKFSGDPASRSPLPSLTLLLTRELERGSTVALRWHMLDYSNRTYPSYPLAIITTFYSHGTYSSFCDIL